MDNQLVNFVEQNAGSLTARALQFISQLTPEQRTALWRGINNAGEQGIDLLRTVINHSLEGWREISDDVAYYTGVGNSVIDARRRARGQESDSVQRMLNSESRPSLSNSMSNTQENQPQPTKVSAMASRTAGPERNVLGGGETAITPQKPHYGVPFTTTTILPYTTYFTACTNSNQNMYNFYLRLNSPFDPLETSIATDPAAGGALTAGLYKVKPGDGQTFTNPLLSYPKSSNSGTYTSERPQWRLYYEKLYNKYTVLGCEYEITFYNPNNEVGRDVAIAIGKEALSVANNGRVYPTNVPLEEAEYWHGLEWKVCRSYKDGTTDGRYVTFKGYYRPGETDMNVQNDEDIKLWTTSGSTPTLNERLMIGIAQAAFNSDTNVKALQVKAKMKYIVQWKDLNVNLMFPASGQTAFTNTYPTDILDLA